MDQVRIFRYQDSLSVTSPLDPLTDITSWVRGLRSVAYTSDLLEETHNLKSSQITSAAESISAYVKIAVEYLDQAFSGPFEISYLPIYYSLLNLSKAIISAAGKRSELKTQRLHGAGWTGSTRRILDLKNDEITLHEKGAIPLLYKTLTGRMWPKTRRKPNLSWVHDYTRAIKLDQIYPYIVPINYEYVQVYGDKETLRAIIVYYEEPDTNTAQIVIEFSTGQPPSRSERRKYKILTGFSRVDDVLVISRPKASLGPDPRSDLYSYLRSYLLYDSPSTISSTVWVGKFKGSLESRFAGTLTPISSSNLLLPEELPLLLAFFHLSSVARYDPERLEQLFDSSCAGMLEALIKQGTYRFLELFWSFMIKKTIFLGR